MRKFLLITLVLAMAALISIFGSQLQAQSFNAKPPVLKLGEPLPGNLFVELAKAINPGVVNIATSVVARNVQRDPMLDMLERFYGMPSQQPRNNRPRQMGLGTGFIVRDDGLIVTNAHVIQGADIITVQLEENSDKTYEATVLGSDMRSDIALIKIKPTGKLTALALGSSSTAQVGEWVAAFGNPFGHGHSMSKGVISSTARSIGEINKYPLLQTDASINPGNSGGPLVNTRGEVIGVNSAIDARAQGIGFAIPIDEVKRIIPQLETRGSVRKGYLGVGLSDISSYDESVEGAGVVSVERGSPAAKAGVKMYDIFTEFNGKRIRNSTDLTDMVGDAEPGSTVKAKLLRQQGNRTREMTISMVVQERPADNQLRRRSSARPAAPPVEGIEAPGLGFVAQDLTNDLRTNLDLPEGLKKPVVSGVEQGSPAAFVGIMPGDVILEVNKTEVSTAADAIKKLKKGENILKLARGNRIMIVSVRPGERR
jgi:serine protease Do